MTPTNEQELQQAIREVVKLASVDPDFRAKAISNANAALSSVSGGKKIDSNIHFVDDFGSGGRTIVLPDPVSIGSLSEAELEQVAGGCLLTTCGEVSCNHTGEEAV